MSERFSNRMDVRVFDIDAQGHLSAGVDREVPLTNAHGELISVKEESWPEVPGSQTLRAVLSVEADNADTVRWYAHGILRLHEG